METMLTHAMLLQMLVEAEARRDDQTLPQEVRDRSTETVSLCKQRMAKEGLTRAQLEELALADA
jgi:type VI protein secretion system component VasF